MIRSFCAFCDAARAIACLALLVPAAVCLASSAAAAPAKTLYVSPAGDNAWSGTLPEPNPAKTDGPLATLEGARDRIREFKKHGPLPAGGVTVVLRGGVYERSGPFELSAEDSGTEMAPVVYRAAEGEEVRLTGGRAVTRFKPVVDPAVLSRLDEAARGHVLQADLRAQGMTDYGSAGGGGLELFFDDRPMTVARWPNDGFIHITGLVGGDPVDVRGTKGDKIGKFMYEGDRPKRWVAEKDAWVHGYWFWDWSDQRHKVAAIDPEKRTISVQPPYHGYGYRKGQWFYGFNLLCELDQPGEWHLDRESGVLYFWPPGPIDKARTVVSVVHDVIVARDVSHLTVQGLTIEAARGSGVVARGGSRFRVAGCTLRNLGAWAVQISGGTESGAVACDVYGTGEGGVSLAGGDRKTLTPAGHFASNNHIHHYSRWHRICRPAIALDGVGNRADHNLIHDAPHQAVAFGGNDHVIELNEMHHVCQESNDAGAIYAGRDWTMRGTVVRHNFMHHVSGFQDRGCVGVYLDDMFCGTEIRGNVFYRVTRAAFIGGGRDCAVENNIFVECNPALHVDSRAMGWAGYHVATTMTERLKAMPYLAPPWSTRYPRLVSILDDEPAAPKGNLVARNVSFGGRWDDVDAKARPLVRFEDNLIGVDPGFVNAAEMDFRLRPDSPVLKQVPGFKPIPFEQIGLVKDEYRKSPVARRRGQ